jgi:archaeal flagellar protein FlaI
MNEEKGKISGIVRLKERLFRFGPKSELKDEATKFASYPSEGSKQHQTATAISAAESSQEAQSLPPQSFGSNEAVHAESREPETPEKDKSVTESLDEPKVSEQPADSVELPANPAADAEVQVEKPEPGKTVHKKLFSGLFAKTQLPQAPTAFFGKLPSDAQTTETYDIVSPFSKVIIASLKELGSGKAYYIDEVEPAENEKEPLRTLLEIISKELAPPKSGVDPKYHVEAEARRLAKKYGLTKRISEESWPKIMYYLHRNLIGFGDIDVIMNDPMIEDLSVNGVGLPVYVWHRKYESMPTNLIFTNETMLDNLIVKLTHMANKHISTAFPLLDAMLPGKDRIAATFKREVSPKGGSFSIRRFREDPFSIVDLVEMGTLNEEIAAYFWLLIENRMTIAVMGGTGAGKTSTLNALASLIKPSMKIVTVEEIPELNLHHENWVQLVARESYGLGIMKTGEVPLFDLVRTSLRYRPDYIVVGEIRGEEAFVLFQALATGHGGLTTLHAESLDYTVKRLTSPPMNVAPTYIPLINVAAMVERVQLPNSAVGGMTFGRRIKSIMEVIDYEKYKTISSWNPTNDSFAMNLRKSDQLKKIASRHNLSLEEVLSELEARANFIQDLKVKGIRKNVELAKQITNYYLENQFPKMVEKEIKVAA